MNNISASLADNELRCLLAAAGPAPAPSWPGPPLLALAYGPFAQQAASTSNGADLVWSGVAPGIASCERRWRRRLRQCFRLKVRTLGLFGQGNVTYALLLPATGGEVEM